MSAGCSAANGTSIMRLRDNNAKLIGTAARDFDGSLNWGRF